MIAAALPTNSIGGAGSPGPSRRAPGDQPFWYRIGHGHVRLIYAAHEAAAGAAVLARHPGARGQRLHLVPWQQVPWQR